MIKRFEIKTASLKILNTLISNDLNAEHILNETGLHTAFGFTYTKKQPIVYVYIFL